MKNKSNKDKIFKNIKTQDTIKHLKELIKNETKCDEVIISKSKKTDKNFEEIVVNSDYNIYVKNKKSIIDTDIKNYVNYILDIYENYQEKISSENTMRREVKLSKIQFVSKLRILADKFDCGKDGHTRRIGKLSKQLALDIGLNEKYSYEIGLYAPMHDIGKALVPSNILNKPGKLNKEEYEIIKKHVLYGAEILQGIDWLKIAWEISLYHHERYGGGGYPFSLSGDKIPVSARIVSIIDVYDSIRGKKVYKETLTHDETLEKMIQMQNHYKHFDPEFFDIFLKNNEKYDIIFDQN
jgi:HD-GYP domain-containing protein (c-di-GMP phosphodiesterase class II)